MKTAQKLSFGTLTIKGWLPCDMAGNRSNSNETRRYRLTERGYVRGSKLFKTFDPEMILKASGLVDAEIVSQSFKVPT